MTCRNTDIQELLPAYLEQALDPDGREQVGAHLAGCEDCRTELDLLRAMSEESVPDPGEAFWAALPGRVYREVQERAVKKHAPLSWITDRIVLPRWVWASAAMAILLLVAWLVFNPSAHRGNERLIADEYDYSYGSVHDPTLTHPSLNMHALSVPELESVDSWAAQQLNTATSEAEAAMVADSDPVEDLSDLNRQEIDRFSRLLTQYEEEVS